MKLHFWGAAGTVTGSSHYIEVNGHKIVLDCGLFQGRRKNTYKMNSNFKFPPDQIDSVILSHAHIDHIGNLPNFSKNGYSGPVYTTKATAELAALMLRDSGRIQESDVKYINKRRKRQGKVPFEPLYTEQDAQKISTQLVSKRITDSFEVAPGVVASFAEAGHILGSTAVILDIDEGGKKSRLWFSGDIGRLNKPILRDPIMPVDADFLIMESTYGERPHKSPEYAKNKLQKVVKETLNRGGKVIIPAFAVGRTQELVYALHRLMDAGEIPKVPVFVDSPLAVNVTDVFRKNQQIFDEEATKMIKEDIHGAALGFDNLKYIRSVDDSMALNYRKDPMIIISASGMVEFGRILHHLKHNIGDPNSTLLIVSWQAPHTLGRRLVEKEPQVKIFGEIYDRKIQVEVINGYSAHAGQTELIDYAMALKGRVKETFFVHGDPSSANTLKEKLMDKGMSNLFVPQRGWSHEV
jgi:metallo-beta-lactamase family protein